MVECKAQLLPDIARENVRGLIGFVVEVKLLFPTRHQVAEDLRVQRFLVLDVVMQGGFGETGTFGTPSRRRAKAVLAELRNGGLADGLLDLDTALLRFGAALRWRRICNPRGEFRRPLPLCASTSSAPTISRLGVALAA